MKSYFTSGFLASAVIAALLLTQPGVIGGSLDRGQRGRTSPGSLDGKAGKATKGNLDAAATVVASFQNQYLCFNFNSDGTISSQYLVGFVIVTSSGVYLGIPGILTVFAYTGTLESRGVAPFSSFGVGIGPFSVEIFTIYSVTSILGSFQTASCPG